jgi:sulfur carrier protein
MTRLKINGVEEDLVVTTVSELLAARGVDPATKHLAVAVNGCVVRRAEWYSTQLGPGDDVEIVKPFSGG